MVSLVFMGPGRACSFCNRDLWDVMHFVSAGPLAICDECVDAAREAIERADPTAGRELFLPPRVFGEAGTDQDAAAIAEAFRTVFNGASTQEELARYIDGGEAMLTLMAEARQRVRGHNVSARVERIRFLTADEAEVRFQVLGPAFEGRGVRRDGRWLVSADTIVRVTAAAGVTRP
jgi:hypothetical protein